jgi:hypothetical protein
MVSVGAEYSPITEFSRPLRYYARQVRVRRIVPAMSETVALTFPLRNQVLSAHDLLVYGPPYAELILCQQH